MFLDQFSLCLEHSPFSPYKITEPSSPQQGLSPNRTLYDFTHFHHTIADTNSLFLLNISGRFCNEMATVVEALGELLNFPETIDKFVLSSPRLNHSNHLHRGGGGVVLPADILDTPKEYIFYMDVPGLSKSDIQVPIPFRFRNRSRT